MNLTTLNLVLLMMFAEPLCAQAPEIIHYTFDNNDASNSASPGVGNGIANNEVAFSPSSSCLLGRSAVSGGANAGIESGWSMDLGTGDWAVGFHLTRAGSQTSNQYYFGSSSSGGFRAFSGGSAGVENIMLRTTMGGDVVILAGAPYNGSAHVVWVHDSTVPEVRGYLNGVFQVAVPQVSPGDGVNGKAPDFQVMTYLSSMFQGDQMDDFRFYRRAITEAEILEWSACSGAIVNTFCDPMDPNSTGASTTLSGAFGSGVGTGLHLEATMGPPGAFGYFLIGTGFNEPGVVVSQGRLCLSSSGGNLFGRYNENVGNPDSIGQFDSSGVLQNLLGTSTVGSGYDVPLNVPIPGFGNIQAGETWHFQLWHREAGGASNFSNGITVTF